MKLKRASAQYPASSGEYKVGDMVYGSRHVSASHEKGEVLGVVRRGPDDLHYYVCFPGNAFALLPACHVSCKPLCALRRAVCKGALQISASNCPFNWADVSRSTGFSDAPEDCFTTLTSKTDSPTDGREVTMSPSSSSQGGKAKYDAQRLAAGGVDTASSRLGRMASRIPPELRYLLTTQPHDTTLERKLSDQCPDHCGISWDVHDMLFRRSATLESIR